MRENPNLKQEEAIGHIIREELGISKLKAEAKTESKDPKKVIREEELERYLAEGWDAKMVLPSGKILVERSH